MKSTKLIFNLVDNSTNVFGQLLGLSEKEKLEKTLYITKNAIHEVFNLDSSTLTQKSLTKILFKNTFDLDEAQQLTYLLCSQAELLGKLNKKRQSLNNYENALEIMYWKLKQSTDKRTSEIKNKIIEVESIIKNIKNYNKKQSIKTKNQS